MNMSKELNQQVAKKDVLWTRRGFLKFSGAVLVTATTSMIVPSREVRAQEDTSFMLGSVNLSQPFIETIDKTENYMDPLPQKKGIIDPEDKKAFNLWDGPGWNDTIVIHTSIPNVYVLYGHTRNHYVKGEKVPLPHEWIRFAGPEGYLAIKQGKEVVKLETTFPKKVDTSYFWNCIKPNQNGIAEFQIGNIALPSDILQGLSNGGVIFAGCGDRDELNPNEFANQQVLVSRLYA